MAEAIFGLLGVIVGGVLQSTGSWAMERRRESWAAKKSGRLFSPHLFRCALVIDHAIEHGSTWGELITVTEANLAPWPEHAEVFAGTIDFEQWGEIYAAVRALEQLTWAAPDDPSELITEEQGEDLARLIEPTFGAAMECNVIGLAGVGRFRVRRFFRGIWRRVRPIDEEAEIERILGELDDER
jgi:hypothetical protein